MVFVTQIMQLITFNLQLIQVIFLYNLLINCVHSRFSIKPPFKFSGQSSKSNVTTENPFVGRDEPDVYWIDALRDIAYFLRRYKFIEYDRRYHKNSNNAPRQYFAHFPKPPLRTLHWEVHKYCEETFVACVEHLHSRIKKTDLRRSDDTGVVMLQQNWSFEKNKQQIDAVQTECEKLKKNSEILINPFEGIFFLLNRNKYFFLFYFILRAFRTFSMEYNCKLLYVLVYNARSSRFTTSKRKLR